MIEDLKTTEQEELGIIIDGLDMQAEDLEDTAADIKDSAQSFGAMALLSGGATIALNYVPEQWAYEKEEATALFTVLAIGTVVQFLRRQKYKIRAGRKRQLVSELQDEANLMEQLPVY
ncbi:MAG: hypothetical protein ABSD10_00765 [Candidatus Saccharimonadales bacterium]|jgi:hypothetical protein